MIRLNSILRISSCALLLIATGCGNGAETRVVSLEDSVAAVSNGDAVIVNNAPEMYSARFIEALRKSGIANKYTLEQNIIMRDDTVEAYFYDYLELKKEYVLHDCVGSTCYNLWISRISNTTIKYLLEERIDDGNPKTMKGEADLSPGFMLASENDEAEDGESYEACEYIDASACNLSIRIGRTGGDNLKGRITKRCEDGSGELKLEDGPFLVEHE